MRNENENYGLGGLPECTCSAAIARPTDRAAKRKPSFRRTGSAPGKGRKMKIENGQKKNFLQQCFWPQRQVRSGLAAVQARLHPGAFAETGIKQKTTSEDSFQTVKVS